MLIEQALVDAAEGGQLPSRCEVDTDGTVRIWFPFGQLYVARWDHSGERAAFVGTWFMRPRFDA